MIIYVFYMHYLYLNYQMRCIYFNILYINMSIIFETSQVFDKLKNIEAIKMQNSLICSCISCL